MGNAEGMNMTSPDERPTRRGAAHGREDAAARAGGVSEHGLSRPMRITLWSVGAVVVTGMLIALAFALAPSAAGPGATPSIEASPTRGPDPEGTPVAGTEVPPPDGSAADPHRLPSSEASDPLVTAPLPSSASAQGSLVEGFPADIMGPTADSDVVSSSIATEDDTMQVTLVARTDRPEEDVRAHFRSVWTSLGLAADPNDQGASLAFGDGANSLSLAFAAASGTGTVYTIYGVFRAG